MTNPTDEGHQMAQFAYYGITTPADEAEAALLDPAEVSSLIDMVLAQIEYCQAEIARLRPILHRLQDRIPNSPIKDFIQSLD